MIRSTSVLALALVLAGCSDSRQHTAAAVTQPPAIRVSGAPNTIPKGTRVEVRTNEGMSSAAGEGRTYAAEISTDIRDANGAVLIPKGSPVELVVLEARSRSGVKGPSVQLGMQSVTVRGTNYLVVSRDLDQTSGLGKNRRTAEMVGGGAALGTLIGAAMGGARGGVAGAVAGALAGAAAQVLTQGKEVRIPAETVLQFSLEEPLVLQPATVP